MASLSSQRTWEEDKAEQVYARAAGGSFEQFSFLCLGTSARGSARPEEGRAADPSLVFCVPGSRLEKAQGALNGRAWGKTGGLQYEKRSPVPSLAKGPVQLHPAPTLLGAAIISRGVGISLVIQQETYF